MAENSSARPNPVLRTSLPTTHAAASSMTKEKSSTASQKKPEPNPRHLAIALHHANQIQARKDTEALILNHIETLQSLPTSPNATASSPSPTDVSTLKSALRPFQPGDYDNLILERNIDGNCGYALCPEEHRKEDPRSKFRVVWGQKGTGSCGRGREMKVVPKEKLEMWCSEECAERAMYLRVQLSEKPAWERLETVEITLLEEAREAREEDKSKGKGKAKEEVDQKTEIVTDKIGKMEIGSAARDGQAKSAEQREAESKDLALERGSSSALPDFAGAGLDIVEKNPDANAITAPSLTAADSEGGTVEGYRPKAGRDEHAHNDDDMLQDDDGEGDYAEDLLPYI
ncbi:hypothetical protein FQN54_008866 [Arachnomyces sp. PD_36]|nr:hypothetical protein FQN54_008866 [Arachnomyces sp. PD_36]